VRTLPAALAALIPLLLSTVGAWAQEKAQEKGAPPKAAANIDVEPDVEYGKAGERSLKLDVIKAKSPNGAKLPIVVWIHGGGWQGGDKASGRGLLAGLVGSGNYVGFSVGYRLTGEAIWPAQAHDCKAALRWIRANAEKYGGDPDKIGLWGSSAGGHLVSLLGTSSDVKELDGANGTPGVSMKVTCVVDYCGPSDFSNFRHPAVEKLFGGTYDKVPEAAKLASPVTHVTADDPPFLVVHGTADATVPFSQGESFHNALKKAGVNSTLLVLTDGGHGIGGPEVTGRVRTFLEHHLRGQAEVVSAAPIKVDPAKTPPKKNDAPKSEAPKAEAPKGA
jgi:acetyl esterase/lipase